MTRAMCRKFAVLCCGVCFSWLGLGLAAVGGCAGAQAIQGIPGDVSIDVTQTQDFNGENP